MRLLIAPLHWYCKVGIYGMGLLRRQGRSLDGLLQQATADRYLSLQRLLKGKDFGMFGVIEEVLFESSCVVHGWRTTTTLQQAKVSCSSIRTR